MNKPWAVRGASGTSYNPSPPPPPLNGSPGEGYPWPGSHHIPARPTSRAHCPYFYIQGCLCVLAKGVRVRSAWLEIFFKNRTGASYRSIHINVYSTNPGVSLLYPSEKWRPGIARRTGRQYRPKICHPTCTQEKKNIAGFTYMVCTISYFLSKSFIIMIFRRMEIAFLETKIFTVYWR